MKVGFIGCGNMASAMILGIIKSEKYSCEDIIVSNRSLEKLSIVKSKTNVQITQDNLEVAKVSDILILAVKPKQYKQVINEIKDVMKENSIFVSITSSFTLNELQDMFNKKTKIIISMPNTPSEVLAGMSAICPNENITSTELKNVIYLFSSFSKVEVIDESLFDSVVAVSGCAPAYVYMFIEALADGAVMQGMPRDMAYRFASQTLLGSAKMILDTNEHPGVLKDKVCSPGGTTIKAVHVLEDKGFRSAVISAMKACKS